MQKTVTLKDIASETGLNISTVSRALDPKASSLLTSDVVQRVRGAAERMGYRKNHLARGLRTRRSMTVGIMLPDITNTIFAPIVRGTESVLEPLGYAPIIVNTDDDPAREDTLYKVLLERGVDGIIHVAVHRTDPRRAEAGLEELPVVTANREIERSSIPCVVNDDAEGIRMMVRLLHDSGHRRIAGIAGPPNSSTGRQRLQAFEHEARELDLDLPDRAVARSTRYDEEEGRRCALELLEGGWKFTAIACANDRLALGAIDALRSKGLSCPENVSVTGFNDIPFLDLIPPGLTTVRIQQFGVGKLSAELLVKMMTDPTAPIPTKTILPVTVVERGSVAAPQALSE